MNKSKIAAAVLVSLFMSHSSAFAVPPQLNAFAGASYLNLKANTNDETVSATRESGNTFGVSATLNAEEPLSYELGLIRLPNAYQVPVLLRLGANGLLTGGLGAYMNTKNQNNQDEAAFGALAALGFNFGINSKTFGFIEGRALRNFEKSFFSFNDGSTDSLLLAGLRLTLD